MTNKDIKKIQGDLNCQSFGLLTGVSTVTVWRWRTGSAKPEGAALRLLELIRDKKITLSMLRDYIGSRMKKSI